MTGKGGGGQVDVHVNSRYQQLTDSCSSSHFSQTGQAVGDMSITNPTSDYTVDLIWIIQRKCSDRISSDLEKSQIQPCV